MQKHFTVALLVASGAGVLLYSQAQYQPRDKMVEQVVAETKFRTQPGFVIERMNPPGRSDSYVILTFDAQGRPVVAKEYDVPLRLLDKDGDGIYESEQVITDKLNTCQGLWFDGSTMYANCHATETEQDVAKRQADVAGVLASQTAVRGSTSGQVVAAVAAVAAARARQGSRPRRGAARRRRQQDEAALPFRSA